MESSSAGDFCVILPSYIVGPFLEFKKQQSCWKKYGFPPSSEGVLSSSSNYYQRQD